MMSSEPVILDVRTPEEYAQGHVQGAKLLDFNGGEFAARMFELDPDATYYLYCRSGNRSGMAAQILLDAGFRHAQNLGSVAEAAQALDLPIQ